MPDTLLTRLAGETTSKPFVNSTQVMTVQMPAMLPHLAGPIRLIFAFAWAFQSLQSIECYVICLELKNTL
jgi:hypothetical protein